MFDMYVITSFLYFRVHETLYACYTCILRQKFNHYPRSCEQCNDLNLTYRSDHLNILEKFTCQIAYLFGF